MTTFRRALWRSAGAALLVGTAACNDFLAVDNPNVIDASAIDPVADASVLAASSQQNFAVAHGWLTMYSSWFTGETLVSETFPTRNEYGRRDVAEANGSHNADVWVPLQVAMASTKLVLDRDLPTPGSNINRARAATWRGYSFLRMATDFCSGTVSSGPELNTAQMLDSAVVWFTEAVTVGRAVGTADGNNLANAALVGRARAHLQARRNPQALADANAVPAGFNFNFTFVDDLANRTRLGNRLWQFTFDRGSMSVAPAFHQMNDPRVRFKAPGTHALAPQDPGSGPFYIQDKYPGFTAPLRLASKLQADYVAAEASGDIQQQLALINARRAVGNQGPYTGPTDAASVLAELMDQSARDFFLEGTRLGDTRRNPTAVKYMPVPGSTYFKPGFAPVGSQTCYPIPIAEKDNNPNFRA